MAAIDADRHRGRRRLAERQDFSRLEEPQQLGLEVEAELADLVEEQRALARRADDAGVVAVGAGEGAAAVAEQLAFEHLARHGRAVERDEGAVRAIGMRVDRAREDLLARAALARDEDADARARDAPRDRHQIAQVSGDHRLARLGCGVVDRPEGEALFAFGAAALELLHGAQQDRGGVDAGGGLRVGAGPHDDVDRPVARGSDGEQAGRSVFGRAGIAGGEGGEDLRAAVGVAGARLG